jgi:glutathione peroxidase
MMASIYDYSAETLDGQTVPLAAYRGKVLLIVNTASQCGFTPQYEGLQKLHTDYGPRGFSVLGFPCNQFGHQEPGSAEEIARFCSLRYNVGFPMFAKIDVNGEHAHPLFRFLKAAKKGIFGTAAVKWNFTKFLIDRRGQVTSRFAPKTKPVQLARPIERLL